VIREVCEGINAKLVAILEQVGDPEIPSFGLGEDATTESAAFPRIVWIPRSGRADNWNSRVSADGKRNPRFRWSRNLHFEVHVWAKDIDAVETLAEQLVQAIHFMTVGSYSMVGEEWNTASATQSGILGVFTFEIRMPFCSETNPAIKIDKPTITPAVVAS